MGHSDGDPADDEQGPGDSGGESFLAETQPTNNRVLQIRLILSLSQEGALLNSLIIERLAIFFESKLETTISISIHFTSIY